MHKKTSNWRIAWENSRHLATLPLVSPPNDVWETSAEIPYWWRVTTQIWEVLLIGWIKFPTRHSLYKDLMEPHFDYCNAVWMAWSNSLVRNFKNFKIVLSELSLNLDMIRTTDIFLTRLVRRAKQKANLMYKCINNLAPAHLGNLFVLRTSNYYFWERQEKN